MPTCSCCGASDRPISDLGLCEKCAAYIASLGHPTTWREKFVSAPSGDVRERAARVLFDYDDFCFQCLREARGIVDVLYDAGLLAALAPDAVAKERVDVPPPTKGKCDEVERFRAESPANNIRYLCEAIALAAVCDDDYEPHVQEILNALAPDAGAVTRDELWDAMSVAFNGVNPEWDSGSIWGILGDSVDACCELLRSKGIEVDAGGKVDGDASR